MKTFHKLLTAGAITAFSFSATAIAQVSPSQPGQQSTQAQERSEQRTPQALERSEQQSSSSQSRQQSALERAQEQQESQQQFGARAEQHNKASELKGSKLNTQSGESLGEVEDIAINLQTGELAFLLVGADGGEWKPVPPQAVNVQKTGDETELSTNIDQQKWEQAETIQQEEVAQLSQEQRAKQIYQFFGEDYQQHQQQRQFGSPDRQSSQQSSSPGAQSSSSPSAQSSQPSSTPEYGQQQRPGERVGQSPQTQTSRSQAQSGQQQKGQASLGSKLMEAKIQNQQQQEIGQISDFILNVEEGQIDFVLIEPEEQEGMFAISPQAFQMSGQDQVRLNVDQQDFQQAQELREGEIAQRAQQARMSGSQAQQSPEVFRYEAEESSTLFGSPGREAEDKKSKAKEHKEKETAR